MADSEFQNKNKKLKVKMKKVWNVLNQKVYKKNEELHKHQGLPYDKTCVVVCTPKQYDLSLA